MLILGNRCSSSSDYPLPLVADCVVLEGEDQEVLLEKFEYLMQTGVGQVEAAEVILEDIKKRNCFCIFANEEYFLDRSQCAGYQATDPDGREKLMNDRDRLVKELRKCKRNPKGC